MCYNGQYKTNLNKEIEKIDLSSDYRLKLVYMKSDSVVISE